MNMLVCYNIRHIWIKEKTVMETEQARKYLKELFKPEFSHYIENVLAGDFAVILVRNYKQQQEELRRMKNEIV